MPYILDCECFNITWWVCPKIFLGEFKFWLKQLATAPLTHSLQKMFLNMLGIPAKTGTFSLTSHYVKCLFSWNFHVYGEELVLKTVTSILCLQTLWWCHNPHLACNVTCIAESPVKRVGTKGMKETSSDKKFEDAVNTSPPTKQPEDSPSAPKRKSPHSSEWRYLLQKLSV